MNLLRIDLARSDLPEGFVYFAPGVSEVRVHGVVARRQVAHSGWNYAYETFRITLGPPIPEFLRPLHRSVAELTQRNPEEFGEVLITEYPAGAGIGRHRNTPSFEIIVGVSLVGGAGCGYDRWVRPAGAALHSGNGVAPLLDYVEHASEKRPEEEPR